jgi:murein L,D-transpeptidase YafK
MTAADYATDGRARSSPTVARCDALYIEYRYRRIHMSPKKQPPPKTTDDKPASSPNDEERGTNAVEHEPDPKAQPLPDGEHKYVPKSPYTTGND